MSFTVELGQGVGKPENDTREFPQGDELVTFSPPYPFNS